MKNKYLILILSIFLLKASTGFCTKHTIVSAIQGSSFVFSPDSVTASVGDSIVFSLNIAHFPKEVDEAHWLANDSVSNGGFILPSGGGTYVIDQVKTYYYVCGVHFGMGMKGRIFVIGTGFKESSNKSFGFEVFPNPIASKATLKTNLPPGKANQMRVFDNKGNCVYQKDNVTSVDHLDVTTFAEGLYIVAIKSEDILIERKIMVSRLYNHR